jgi:hypothetical protein
VAESLTIADGTRHPPSAWKAELDAQFANGMNAAMIHLWSHQPDVHARPGLFTFDALNANMTWWERSDAFLDYLGRCQFLLRQGHSVADCCYFFGEDTAQFVPGRKEVQPALPAGYEFDGINAEVILTRLTCRDGLATLPNGQAYRYLVLPAAKGWPVTLPVLEKLAGLVAEGLTVIGPRPGPSPRLLDPAADGERREGIIRSLWGDDAAEFTRRAMHGCGFRNFAIFEHCLALFGRGSSDAAHCWHPSVRETLMVLTPSAHVSNARSEHSVGKLQFRQ